MKIFVSINLVVFIVLFILNRYKKCPPDRIIVVYGKELKPKCVYGERVFVWPIIQRIKFLDLRPFPDKLEEEKS